MPKVRGLWKRIGPPVITARSLGLLSVIWVLACSGDGDGVGPPPGSGRLVITTPATLPQGTVGSSYEVTLAATGASSAVTWTLESGSLAAGLALAPDGRLAGAPQAAGSTTFVVRAASPGVQPASATLVLTVVMPPLLITTLSLPDATLGSGYSQLLDVAGGDGPVFWSLAEGALPPGINLSASGILAGNATSLGTSAFTVRALRGAFSAERPLTLAVVPRQLVITTGALPNARVGRAYAVQLESAGGIGGNSWELTQGTVPAGLMLSTSGVIAGSPLAPGVSAFTVAVTSGSQRATRNLSLVVDPDTWPSTALVTMPGNVFVPLIVEIAVGGTVTWRFGTEPHNAIFVPAPGAPADINIVSNVDVARTFTVAGTFRYDCTIHPGMSGIVDVRQ